MITYSDLSFALKLGIFVSWFVLGLFIIGFLKALILY